MHRIGPLHFRKWRAYFRVRRADEWRLAGTAAAASWNAALIARGVTDKEAFVGPEFFIPAGYLFDAKQNQPPDQTIQSVLAAAYGPKH